MCGRFRLEISPKDIIGFYKLIEQIDKKYKREQEIIQATMNKDHYPGSVTAAIKGEGVASMLWGFPLDKKLVFNGRSESLDEKMMFKNLIASNRCLIPASLFYEWKDKKKYTIKTEDPYFFMAGLYRKYRDENGRDEDRFVILTTEADQEMQKIHDRMPVIIDKSQLGAYLDAATPKAAVKSFYQPWNRGLAIELADNEQITFF